MEVTALSAIGRAGASAAAQAPSSAASASGGASFTDLLGQIISAGVNTIQAGEAAAIQGLSAGAPPFKVVEAVMAAQRTLQEGLAIRDKAVSAYQEISRMAI